MLKSISWSEDRTYRSETENEPYQFYTDSLLASDQFDLLLGYFSSTAISVLSHGFATFIYNGGRIRMAINNILSEADKEAIKNGKDGNVPDLEIHLNDIKALKRTLDDYGRQFFECLAWLIASNRIEIKIIKPKEGKGIAHYKSGVFRDRSDFVGFNSSCNFTAFGLLENLEKLTCHLSWDDRRSHRWIENEMEYFESIFNGTAEFVEYIEIENVVTAIKAEFGSKELDELLVKEQELRESKEKILAKKKIRESQEKALTKIEELAREPKFPFSQGPRDYQEDAYRRWRENNYQGIFAMATGTGKTITSLNCALNEYKSKNLYQIVIVVPTKILVDQWEKEVKRFQFKNIIKVSSKSAKWEADLDQLATQEGFGLSPNFAIITTYASFAKQKFQQFIKKLPKGAILIADEAHNIGSPNVLKVTRNFPLQRRIGLSATPKRVYDLAGSIEMENFFSDSEPYLFSFSMEKAIEEGILCQYYYYPRIVTLLPAELEEYNAITKQLTKFFGRDGLESNSIVERLLMERKRIIHQAQNKLDCFKTITSEILREKGKLDYTLVYAPEGFFSDNPFSNEEDFEELSEENRIIDFYSSIIRKISPTTTITQYTSESENKDFNLAQFESGEINVLLSMKCLDEGVDIPRTEQAIFCSSTGNPRQFIQRRGRILRKHPNKSFAYIYDMIVIPTQSWEGKDFKLEQSLVKSELERVVHFAYMSINKYHAIKELRDVCEMYDLNLDTIHLDLVPSAHEN